MEEAERTLGLVARMLEDSGHDPGDGARLPDSTKNPGLAAPGPSSPPEMSATDRAFLARLRQVIEDGLDDPGLTVEEVARRMDCHRSHLFRRLEALGGETPSSRIRSLRLERARALLQSGAGPVSEVAYAVGFKSLSHFSNTFAKHCGERPSVFAARHRRDRRAATE